MVLAGSFLASAPAAALQDQGAGQDAGDGRDRPGEAVHVPGLGGQLGLAGDGVGIRRLEEEHAVEMRGGDRDQQDEQKIMATIIAAFTTDRFGTPGCASGSRLFDERRQHDEDAADREQRDAEGLEDQQQRQRRRGR